MKWKIPLDIGMTLALLLLMGYGLIGEKTHEWIGVGMFLLFLGHLILNRKWFKGLGKGRYTPARIARTVGNALIFLCMIGCMVSGVMLSRYVFAFLPVHGGLELAGQIHILYSHWGFVLMSLHLGAHLTMLRTAVEKQYPLPVWAGRCLTWLGYFLALYGLFAFFKRDFPDYLLLRSHFVFYDYSQPVVYFLLDYVCILALFTAVGNAGIRLLQKRK